MKATQRKILKKIVAEKGSFAIKHYHKRSVKYRVLTEDRNPIVNVRYSTFMFFLKQEFFKETISDAIKIYVITEKAINYKFKKCKNDK